MIHPQQDEIRRLIENWAAWTGDSKGAVYSTCPLCWTEAEYERRETRLARTDAIKPIGAEAQLTGEVLRAMDRREARALQAYYTRFETAETLARRYLRCSKSTFHRLVLRAHSDFWERYQERRRTAAERAAAMAAVASSARP